MFSFFDGAGDDGSGGSGGAGPFFRALLGVGK